MGIMVSLLVNDLYLVVIFFNASHSEENIVAGNLLSISSKIANFALLDLP